MTTNCVPAGKAVVPAFSWHGVRSGLARLWRAWQHRREVTRLLDADDRMLADIGLTRADVIGSLAEPVDIDPSVHLVRARAERLSARARRRRA